MPKSSKSGAGGSRTLVQTGKPYAFYTLIPAFGFRMPTRPGFGTTSLERRLVSPPCREIKLAIYYTSIKQRERILFRQLIFPQLRLWREPRSLRVLTYHLDPLSNPVNPRCDCRKSAANIVSFPYSCKLFAEKVVILQPFRQ